MLPEEKLMHAIQGGADYEMQQIINLCFHPTLGRLVYTRNAYRHRTFNVPLVFTSTPLVSLRTTAWKSALQEWEWFMSGSNDIRHLPPNVQKWWNPWIARDDTSIYYNYSQQFRDYGYWQFDQIEWVIRSIREHPSSTRHVITTWDTEQMQRSDCKITNCHGTVIHFNVDHDKLNMLMYQRSCDVICGIPHNWIQYWAFLLWIAHRTGLTPGEFHWTGGDVHVYQEHVDTAKRMADMNRYPISTPELVYTPTSPEFLAKDFSLQGVYSPLLTEKVKMVV